MTARAATVDECMQEITALEAEVERMRANHSAAAARAELAQIDNERLRAALQSLTHDPPATLDEPDTDAEVIIKMRAIARTALEPKP